MSLANGRPYLAIPGPSVMPDRVLAAMHRPAPNIYEGALTEMVPGLVADLKTIARTRADVALYIGNGHAGWEAALTNTLSRGDKVLVIDVGRFSVNWGLMADGLGVETEVISSPRGSAADLERVAEVLAADEGHRIKAVLAVHVETSTGVRNDLAAIRGVLDAARHPALLMIDAIACFGCDDMQMDAWGIDVVVTASQKGLMTPPGLAFVFFSAAASQARERANLATPYWCWRLRAAPDLFFRYFNGTAPTHHLYGLRAALDMIAEEGLDAVLARHATLAEAIWAACDAWATEGPLRVLVPERANRSHAVTALRLGAPHGAALRKWSETHAGVTLGIGFGAPEENDPKGQGFFRIGHMGHVNAHMVMGMLGCLQAGMRAGGVAFGPGALDAAAEVIARADAPRT